MSLVPTARKPELFARRKELSEHPYGTMKRGVDQGYFLLKGLRNWSRPSRNRDLAVVAPRCEAPEGLDTPPTRPARQLPGPRENSPRFHAAIVLSLPASRKFSHGLSAC